MRSNILLLTLMIVAFSCTGCGPRWSEALRAAGQSMQRNAQQQQNEFQRQDQFNEDMYQYRVKQWRVGEPYPTRY